MAGRVIELHRKAEVAGEHGLPEPSVHEAFVSRSGLVGDFNRFRHEEKKDDPAMALLLVPRETLAELSREGWPVRPGDLGENLTTEGIGYDAFVPGRGSGRARRPLRSRRPAHRATISSSSPTSALPEGPNFSR